MFASTELRKQLKESRRSEIDGWVIAGVLAGILLTVLAVYAVKENARS